MPVIGDCGMFLFLNRNRFEGLHPPWKWKIRYWKCVKGSGEKTDLICVLLKVENFYLKTFYGEIIFFLERKRQHNHVKKGQ